MAAAPATQPTPQPTTQPTTQVASAAPPSSSEGGFFSSLARKVGFGSAEVTASAPPPAAPAKPAKEAKRGPIKRIESKLAEIKQAVTKPALKPSVTDNPAQAAAPAQAATPAPAAPQASVVAGAQPIVPANSFNSRFGAMQ
jgi:hypothetical protein